MIRWGSSRRRAGRRSGLNGIANMLAQTGTPAIAVTSSSYSGSTATFVITYITGAGITGRVDYSINSGAYTGTATITANPSAGNATIRVPINAALQGATPSFVFTLKNSSTSALLATGAAYTGLAIPGSAIVYNTAIGNGVDANGFTDLPLRSTIAKRFFVGSGGVDTNTGLSHAQRFATLAKAVSLLTSGAGDQILIAEGTTLAETLPQGGDPNSWMAAFPGFSLLYPTVYSSYDPADPTNTAKYGMGHQRSARPVLTRASGQVGNGTYSFIAIKGLDFNPGNAVNNDMNWIGLASGILIENNIFRYMGISYDSGEAQTVAPTMTNYVVRNNSIYGAYTTAGAIGGGGCYVAGNNGVTIEDNVFYHVGWKIGALRDDSYTVGGPTIFRHPVYLQTNSGGTVRRNLMMDCAADGGIARGDITWTENVAIRSPSGIGLGGGPAYDTERPSGINIECSYNLLLAGIDLNSTNPRGDGISMSNGKPGSRTHHNLLIRSTVAAGTNAQDFSNSASFNKPSYGEYENNLAYQWANTTPYYTGGGSFPAQSFATYDRNYWDTATSGTNTINTGLTFPNAYTEASLYTAAGVTDYATLVSLAINNPQNQYQRTLRTLAFAGYNRNAAAIDTTAPTLTLPTASVATTTVTAGVTTDDATGTIYCVLTTSATPPHPSQIKMGLDGTGAAAAKASSQAVSASGAKTFTLASVAGGTYYAHFTHEDAEVNKATAVSSTSVIVASVATVWATATDWANTNANLTITRNAIATFWGKILASAAKTNGTAIHTVNALGAAAVQIGLDVGTEAANLGADSGGASISYDSNGNIVYAGGNIVTALATYTTGDVIKIIKAGTNVSFYKNNVQQGATIDVRSATWGATGSLLNGAAYPAVTTFHNTGAQITTDFTGW